MAKENELDKLIPRFYKRKAYHLLIFGGVTMLLKADPDMTIADAIDLTLKTFDINCDDLDIRHVGNIYNFTRADFFDSLKTKS